MTHKDLSPEAQAALDAARQQVAMHHISRTSTEPAESIEAMEGRIRSEERERCAKLAEKFAFDNLNADGDATPLSSIAQNIANMIRLA